MPKPYLVEVHGVTKTNSDGVVRQAVIRNLRRGQAVQLVPELKNQFQRWEVAVYTQDGVLIGHLPAEFRDTAALLRGEPVMANVAHLRGGSNWFYRVLLGRKNIDVVLRITCPEPDQNRYRELVEKARPLDEQNELASDLDKAGQTDAAITQYQSAVDAIAQLTEADPYASAHRLHPTPVNRLSLLLEKQRNYQEALEVIENFLDSRDPVQPGMYEMDLILKRQQWLLGQLKR